MDPFLPITRTLLKLRRGLSPTDWAVMTDFLEAWIVECRWRPDPLAVFAVPFRSFQYAQATVAGSIQRLVATKLLERVQSRVGATTTYRLGAVARKGMNSRAPAAGSDLVVELPLFETASANEALPLKPLQQMKRFVSKTASANEALPLQQMKRTASVNEALPLQQMKRPKDIERKRNRERARDPRARTRGPASPKSEEEEEEAAAILRDLRDIFCDLWAHVPRHAAKSYPDGDTEVESRALTLTAAFCRKQRIPADRVFLEYLRLTDRKLVDEWHPIGLLPYSFTKILRRITESSDGVARDDGAAAGPEQAAPEPARCRHASIEACEAYKQRLHPFTVQDGQEVCAGRGVILIAEGDAFATDEEGNTTRRACERYEGEDA